MESIWNLTGRVVEVKQVRTDTPPETIEAKVVLGKCYSLAVFL
jgi:hypothetical protein